MDINDVVSKDEVDALLDDSNGCEKTSSADGVHAYDFCSSAHKQINDLSQLEMVNELFTSEIRGRINHFLARNADVVSEPSQVMAFKDYVESIKKPTLIYFIAMKPLTGVGIIHFSTELVNKIIELLFGGNIHCETQQEREFGKVELQIVALLLDIINRSFSSSWKIIKPLEYEIIKATTKPSMLAKHEDEKTIVTTYKICLDKQEWAFTHSIPFSTVEPIQHLIEGNNEDDLESVEHEAWSKAFMENIHGIKTPVTAVVATAEIKLYELKQLKAGDVISIDNPSLANIYTENLLMYRAKCGLSNGNRAVKIIEQMKD